MSDVSIRWIFGPSVRTGTAETERAPRSVENHGSLGRIHGFVGLSISVSKRPSRCIGAIFFKSALDFAFLFMERLIF